MQSLEINARDRGEPMPFVGESRPDPENGFTRHNPQDDRFYATPTIFNLANFPWYPQRGIQDVPIQTWPREVWRIPPAEQERWRRVIETRERD